MRGLLRTAEEQNSELAEQLKNANATVDQYRAVVLTLEDSLKKEKEVGTATYRLNGGLLSEVIMTYSTKSFILQLKAVSTMQLPEQHFNYYILLRFTCYFPANTGKNIQINIVNDSKQIVQLLK